MSEMLMDEAERRQFNEFKRKMNQQAAQAQIKKIEYNLTDATLDRATLRRACQDTALLKLGAVCVLPCMVKQCRATLGSQSQVLIIACVSFPHGGDSLKTKVAAVKNAVKDGADEVEVTAPISSIKDGNWSYVKREFKKMKRAAKKCAVRINVEYSLLTSQELTRVCNVAADCGITSLRTSSGSYAGGFNSDVISVMKTAVKDKCTIKADSIVNITEMNMAVDMGAGIIGSKNALDLGRTILQAAEE